MHIYIRREREGEILHRICIHTYTYTQHAYKTEILECPSKYIQTNTHIYIYMYIHR